MTCRSGWFGGAVVAAVGGVGGCHGVPAGGDPGAGGGAGGGDRAARRAGAERGDRGSGTCARQVSGGWRRWPRCAAGRPGWMRTARVRRVRRGAAALHVTIGLTDLQEMTGAGEVLGSTATGVLLSPEVLRRVACDAALVRTCSARPGRTSTWGGWCACSRGRSVGGCGGGTGAAPSRGARHRGAGRGAPRAALGRWGPVRCRQRGLVVPAPPHFVQRRLWAQVRTTPDELGRYVVWDLHPGSYDQHLEWLARNGEHDPPPLTRQRLLQLVAAVTHSDEADRRLAQHDLDQLSDAWHDWEHRLEPPSTPPTPTTAPGTRPTSPASAPATTPRSTAPLPDLVWHARV